MEWSPERGDRCTMCFDMRFERTALFAKVRAITDSMTKCSMRDKQENGFEFFTTTNATSRWKDAEQVNGCGRRAATKYDGINYFDYDWQTDAMTKRKYVFILTKDTNNNNNFYCFSWF